MVDLHPETLFPHVAGVLPSIEFEHVSLTYPPKEEGASPSTILEDVSFRINPGERVALISPSGGGKTSIFNLLFGYYQPTRGVIRINGQDISKISLNDLQRNISLLGQNPNLFKGSVRENILYGAQNPESVSDEMIFDLARTAGLYDFLQQLPEKLDTDVGEDGKTLSGGQQQKVAILRGLIKKSPILLCDEVTASLDAESIRPILEVIKSQVLQATELMITHKLAEVSFFADRIIVIDGGRVVGQGTHQELLQSCELYHRLWEAHEQPVAASATAFYAAATSSTDDHEKAGAPCSS